MLLMDNVDTHYETKDQEMENKSLSKSETRKLTMVVVFLSIFVATIFGFGLIL